MILLCAKVNQIKDIQIFNKLITLVVYIYCVRVKIIVKKGKIDDEPNTIPISNREYSDIISWTPCSIMLTLKEL